MTAFIMSSHPFLFNIHMLYSQLGRTDPLQPLCKRLHSNVKKKPPINAADPKYEMPCAITRKRMGTSYL